MLDAFVLQIVLMSICFVAAVLAVVWFVAGITPKSAVWIIVCAVPFALIVATVISFIII